MTDSLGAVSGSGHEDEGTADAPAALRRSTWPRYEEDEIAAVTAILRTGAVNSLHHGRYCQQFEREMASLCEVPYGIAVGNGTLALELALRALEIGPGDEVIVPARSFMATASCVVTVGATPVFADVDRDSQNLTAAAIEAVLTERTRAVIPVHLAGWPADMPAICALAQRRNLKVIEDCAQAHGARIAGAPVGSFGDASAFSFCTDKIISTGGEGGMLVLKDRAAWKRAWAFKDHGKDPEHYAAIVPGPDFLWLHTSVGSNFRLTEMQCAIGSLQLGKLPRWTEARRANAAAFHAELADLPALRLPQPETGIEHAAYKAYVFVRPERLKPDWSRRRIIVEAKAQGLALTTGSCPEIYREAAFAHTDWRPPQRLPVAVELGETSLMTQIDHTLAPEDLREAGRRLRGIVVRASA